jgi:hypothetical protein
MDGFSDPIRSLCVLDDLTSRHDDESNEIHRHDINRFVLRNTLLITNGMNENVCLHDFSVDDIDQADYDLEMPEYIS